MELRTGQRLPYRQALPGYFNSHKTIDQDKLNVSAYLNRMISCGAVSV